MRLTIIFIALLLLSGCESGIEKIKPARTLMTESVYASVTVQPEDLYAVYAAAAGVIDEVFIEEGVEVEKGQKLAQITNTASRINQDKAQLSLQSARDNFIGNTAVLNNIEDEIQAARLKLNTDSLNYFRQERLWKQNIGARIELDNRKLAYELSINNLKSLQNKFDRTKRELAVQVRQSEKVLKASQVNVKDFDIQSKMEGKVYAVYKKAGEVISFQEPLATIGSRNSFIIEMLVDEVDIAKVEIGQKALVTLDAYQKEVFEAKVTKIYPRKDERTQTFKTEAIFLKPPNKLFPGLSGEANIVLSEKSAVVTIPIEFLMDGNKVKTENGEEKVSIGLRNLERVEIISGIDTSTFILNPQQ